MELEALTAMRATFEIVIASGSRVRLAGLGLYATTSSPLFKGTRFSKTGILMYTSVASSPGTTSGSSSAFCFLLFLVITGGAEATNVRRGTGVPTKSMPVTLCTTNLPQAMLAFDSSSVHDTHHKGETLSLVVQGFRKNWHF